jgi:hypothetical protein
VGGLDLPRRFAAPARVAMVFNLVWNPGLGSHGMRAYTRNESPSFAARVSPKIFCAERSISLISLSGLPGLW